MNFTYEARTADGRSVNGKMRAESETEVVDRLHEKGVFPVVITCKDAAARRKKTSQKFATHIKLGDRLVFFRQLAAMVSAGITVASSLSVLSEQTQNKKFRAIILDVHKQVSDGRTLADAFEEHRSCFGDLTIPLVRAGEEAGTLDESLSSIADFLEKDNRLRGKIISALTYPCFIISVALLVLGLMVAVVIPQFEKAFANLNVQLPAVTRMTFVFGRWLEHYWWILPVTIIAIVFIYFRMRKIPSMRLTADALKLKIPVFGDIMLKASLARSFGTVSSLLRTGVPVLDAIRLAAEVSGNEKIRQNFITVRDGAAKGTAISAIMREKKLFTPMIGHMTAVGEETGQVDDMLGKAAMWYEEELTEKVKTLSSVLEPVMVAFVGCIVAFMVFAIFMPIVTSINAMM